MSARTTLSRYRLLLLGLVAACQGESTDSTSPSLTLSSAAAEPVRAPFVVTATFAEAVSGFTLEDVVVTNGAAGGMSGGPSVYDLVVAPSAAGPVTVSVGANVAQDAAGNGNTAATSLTRTFENPLRISPERTVLPLAGGGTPVLGMELWAVRDGLRSCPTFMTGEATWSSQNTSIATVNADGFVSPVAAGETWIEATWAGFTARAHVQVQGALHDRGFTLGLRARTYGLYVPASYDGVTPMPLVLVLHGGGGNAHNAMHMSQFQRLAATEGFMVAFADGAHGLAPVQTWNAGACCGYAADNDVNDVAFLRAVVAHVGSDFQVDASRVYATGLSNGSMMAHRLACEASNVFAAVGAVAAGLNVDGVDFVGCAPTRPVPVIMFHGTTDQNYPIQGGMGTGAAGVPFYPVVHASAPDTLDDWRAINAAQGAPTSVTYGAARCDTYSGQAEVVMCVIDPPVPTSSGEVVCDGGGHVWPGGVKSTSSSADVPTDDIDASALIWDFFARHPKP